MFNFPHQLRDSLLFLEDAFDKLFRREVLKVLFGVGVLDVAIDRDEIALLVIFQDVLDREFPGDSQLVESILQKEKRITELMGEIKTALSGRMS